MLSVHHDEIVRAHSLYLEENVLDLAREHVHAAHDEHVVSSGAYAVHTGERAAALTTLRRHRRKIVRAVSKDRKCLFGQRREHELAVLAVHHAAELGIHDSMRKPARGLDASKTAFGDGLAVPA